MSEPEAAFLVSLRLKLGAKHVLGTDLDPCAVPAVAENKEANQIADETFDMVIGNIIDDKAIQDQAGYEKYDIVTANILADVIIPLSGIVAPLLKDDGVFITSGIINTMEEAVKKQCLPIILKSLRLII